MTLTRAAFAEANVDVDGFRIRYLEGGPAAGTPLVWLHGGGGLHLSRAHEMLAERYRVIALEVPGFGDSAANELTQSYPALGATMAATIRQLGLARVNLWGTSFGSVVALWWAIGAPDSVEALVLEAPGALLPEGGVRLSNSPEEMRRPGREETEAKLSELGVPTLVVFGTEDGVVPPAMGRVYREKMPNCNYVLVYDAGHEVGADRPEAFTSLVSDFLERREAFIVNNRSSLLNP